MSETVNVARLKATLSEVLAHVKAGQEVVVTERGRPIALLRKYESSEPDLDDLVRKGLASPGRQAGFDAKRLSPVAADPEGLLLKALLAEREEGR